jgi:ParB-like chromosome segregation protein Spo0J
LRGHASVFSYSVNISVAKALKIYVLRAFCVLSVKTTPEQEKTPEGANIKREDKRMEIVNRKINSIKPYDKNPRKNDDAVQYVAESIKEFGFKVPIVIDSEGVIVAGHTRYKAAQMLKMKEVPCVIADDLTEEQVKAYRLADNKVSEAAEWDFELLTEELENIFEIDMEAFGFMEEEEPEPKERKDLSGEVGEVFQIIVECNSELEQEEIYYKLINEGLQCRTLTL